MKFIREFINSEDDSKLNWGLNNEIMYTVVNKEATNKWGEYRGWKIMPCKSIALRIRTMLSNAVFSNRQPQLSANPEFFYPRQLCELGYTSPLRRPTQGFRAAQRVSVQQLRSLRSCGGLC